MINTIQIALSGLFASQKRLEGSASNIANLNTAGSLTDPDNAPYSAVTTVQQAQTDADGNGTGVRAQTIPQNTPFVPAYDPDSPFADENGVIGVPNVNLAEEAVNITLAETAFSANLKIIEIASELSDELLSAFDND